MTFFNKKEEVINIELTQYGKYLLSIGKFKPVYYQFFDDDIIYDIEYANSAPEKQKEIQDRIKSVPRTRAQYTFVSSETEIKKNRNLVRDNKKGDFSDIYVPQVLKHRVGALPLGYSELGQQKKPAWNIKLLNGEFYDTKTFITGVFSNLAIPRLTLKDTEYRIKVVEENSPQIYAPVDKNDTIADSGFTPTSDLNSLSSRFLDQTYLQVQEDYILLDLKENNVPFESENFEIELYEVSTDENNNEVLTQLFFNKKQENIINNILVDTEEQLTDFRPNRNDLVHTYFNIQADREIDSAILCKKLTEQEKQTLIATNQLDLNREEQYARLPQPRIVTDVMIEDLGDKC